jgi:hypothetical protein
MEINPSASGRLQLATGNQSVKGRKNLKNCIIQNWRLRLTPI